MTGPRPPEVLYPFRRLKGRMAYDRKDSFYRRAKREGYRSRAAYKLQEIDRKFHVIRPHRLVVDLGAAPGGWSQVAVERAGGGFVIAADLKSIEPIPGVECLRMDVLDGAFPEKVLSRGGRADVLLSDMAPDITGNYSVDHARSVHLADRALELAALVLRSGGNIVVKVFQGDMFQELLARYRSQFRRVKCFSPQASRKASSEMYIVGFGYKGGAQEGPAGGRDGADAASDGAGTTPDGADGGGG